MEATTTEKNWLKQFTTKTRDVYLDCLKLRRRDYDGFIPLDVIQMRELKAKVEEHDGILDIVKRGFLQIAGGLGKKK